MEAKIKNFLDLVKERNGHEAEFIQAVEEVAETVIPYIVKHDIYHGKNILLRMVEPERAITFRVNWVDDKGEIQVNLYLADSSKAKISIRGRITCLVSVLPNDTIPWSIFCSSFVVSSLLASSSACDKYPTLRVDFCFPSFL